MDGVRQTFHPRNVPIVKKRNVVVGAIAAELVNNRCLGGYQSHSTPRPRRIVAISSSVTSLSLLASKVPIGDIKILFFTVIPPTFIGVKRFL
jgi:hypothetical protein